MEILRSKHPQAMPVSTEALLDGCSEYKEVHPIEFDQITAASIRSAALRTKGAGGPSGINAHNWRRLCTSFKADSNDLCHALALVAKRLCTSYVVWRSPTLYLTATLGKGLGTWLYQSCSAASYEAAVNYV